MENKTFPISFWRDEVGCKLRERGLNAQVLAIYLLTCPHSNHSGLFYLTPNMTAHHTGLSERVIRALVPVFEEIGFARWDLEHEVVWVVDAALAVMNAQRVMAPSDLRLRAIRKEVKSVAHSPLALAFAEHYHTQIPLGRELVADLRARHGALAPHGA